jgi:hypothetical protein
VSGILEVCTVHPICWLNKTYSSPRRPPRLDMTVYPYLPQAHVAMTSAKRGIMTDTPQLLLAHHLKALKLPTFLREYDKLASAVRRRGPRSYPLSAAPGRTGADRARTAHGGASDQGGWQEGSNLERRLSSVAADEPDREFAGDF